MNKAKLIQLIHIAKSQLALDDDTYRSALRGVTGKTSCKELGVKELTAVLEHFKKSGFKCRSNGSKKRMSPKSSARQLGEINKIRAIWITMHKQGFVRDGSETALDAFVNRMLNRRKVGENVSFHTQFLTYKQAVPVLEALKKWHTREMIEHLMLNELDVYVQTFDDATQRIVATRISMSLLPEYGYEQLREIYEYSINEAKSLPHM
ncbi:regulatory protein GemA [Pseudoalteromonas sp. CO325X]|uniref:gp16 family protein n=1 Tax=Pseudoalteromonas sp. CO325X TaxID=1777262 RepID=UPI001022A62D|nr:regulatory protein GemA [Pseudoalteromonas sp. CO325X]RZF83733.1 regulatory protein GemA [Pseudoalteromonas sp. CO325X]